MVAAQAAQAQRPAATPSPVNNHTASAVPQTHSDVLQGPSVDPQGGLGMLLSGMGNRLHVAEQHTTALEARCSLLDSLLQQHLDSAQQDGVRTSLQTQAQLCNIAASLQHLSLRVDVLERRVARAVEEGEGRLESVLQALVHALRQQDEMGELKAVVMDLARKFEAVETGLGGARVGSPPTPEGGTGLHGTSCVVHVQTCR